MQSSSGLFPDSPCPPPPSSYHHWGSGVRAPSASRCPAFPKSFSSSLTSAGPHQSSVSIPVSAHINLSPPLTFFEPEATEKELKDVRLWFHSTQSFSPSNSPLPNYSTGERGLEVCRHGDRPPLSVDLCVCLCVRHTGHVPAAPLPELHSKNHRKYCRLTLLHPQKLWKTAPTVGPGPEVCMWVCVGACLDFLSFVFYWTGKKTATNKESHPFARFLQWLGVFLWKDNR